MDHAFFRYNQSFSLFGDQHLLMIGTVFVLSVVLPAVAIRYMNARQQLWVARAMSLLFAFWVLFYIAVRIALGDFDRTTDLPLDICNMVGLALPCVMWNPSQKVHEILYFWILAGTFQAVLTPHLFNGYPNFTFFKYWTVHGGLVVYVVYITAVFGLRPTIGSIWKAFVYLQVYVIAVLVLNVLIGSNYIYILGKPPTASALDYFGPWPWYLLVAEAVAFLMFVLIYLPLLLFPTAGSDCHLVKSSS
jgi:hypothetical integral membrane protein (TIGR02206 family)